jgi:hypothetical protein
MGRILKLKTISKVVYSTWKKPTFYFWHSLMYSEVNSSVCYLTEWLTVAHGELA